ncbi:MAG: hypothetical protein ACI4LJ_04140, partial [Anaerovoracaceae bacterium]
ILLKFTGQHLVPLISNLLHLTLSLLCFLCSLYVSSRYTVYYTVRPAAGQPVFPSRAKKPHVSSQKSAFARSKKHLLRCPLPAFRV